MGEIPSESLSSISKRIGPIKKAVQEAPAAAQDAAESAPAAVQEAAESAPAAVQEAVEQSPAADALS